MIELFQQFFTSVLQYMSSFLSVKFFLCRKYAFFAFAKNLTQVTGKRN